MENPFKNAFKTAENKADEQTVTEENVQDSNENPEETTEEKNPETDVTIDEEQKKEETADNTTEQTETNPLQEKYDTLNNQYIRLAADFDNYRKRNEQEREALLKYGAESTLKKMLEVIDNFERGLKAIETVDDCEKVKECYNLAYKNFTEALTKAGLETIKAEGEVFDPNFHEAVMQTPTSDKPENTIIAELQKGYKLGDKVLRPTLVNVATEG